MGNHLAGIWGETDAQPGTFRAGTLGAIEGKVTWSEARCPITGFRIFRFGGKGEVRLSRGSGKVRRGECDEKPALTEPEGQFHGIRQTGAAGILNLEAVDDQFQSLQCSCERAEIDPLALASGPEESLFFQTDRISGGYRCQQDGKIIRMVVEQVIDDLGRGRGEEGAPGFRVVGGAVGGEKDAEVVVNFRGGSKGGSTAAPRMALFHGQSGGESFHRFDGGCGKAFEMKAGMGGETFEVPALALGVNGVKRE